MQGVIWVLSRVMFFLNGFCRLSAIDRILIDSLTHNISASPSCCSSCQQQIMWAQIISHGRYISAEVKADCQNNSDATWRKEKENEPEKRKLFWCLLIPTKTVGWKRLSRFHFPSFKKVCRVCGFFFL